MDLRHVRIARTHLLCASAVLVGLIATSGCGTEGDTDISDGGETESETVADAADENGDEGADAELEEGTAR